MERKIYIDEKELSRILSAVSNICKGKIRFFHDASQYYISSHRENLRFCSMLSRSPKSNYLCTQCNKAANDRCRETRAFHCYFCHASLLEMMYPVLYEGEYVGHISIGQFRSRHRAADDSYFGRLGSLTDIDTGRLRKAYYSQPLIGTEDIKGAELLLEMTARLLCERGVFFTDHRDTISRIEQYVRDHLPGDLSLQAIAGHVYINPSYLSAMYHKATGVPLSKFIQSERINRASYLLSTTTLPIADIACAAGFRDPNYFSKVFQAQVSCLPREFRKKIATGEIIF